MSSPSAWAAQLETLVGGDQDEVVGRGSEMPCEPEGGMQERDSVGRFVDGVVLDVRKNQGIGCFHLTEGGGVNDFLANSKVRPCGMSR